MGDAIASEWRQNLLLIKDQAGQKKIVVVKSQIYREKERVL